MNDILPPPGIDPSPVANGQPGRPQMVAIRLPSNKPVVTYCLLGLTILVFLLQLASQFFFKTDIPVILGVKVNNLIAAGQIWRLFTPMLLHGSVLHIAFNMYALYIFGTQLERFYGHGRYLVLYILAGFAGNVLSFAFSSANSLGASTAIFGLLGAEGVFLYRNWKIFGESARRSLQNLVVLAIINLAIGLTGGYDNWGHLGGLLGGVIFAWLAGPLLKVEAGADGLQVVDQRDSHDLLLGALVVGSVFTFVAIATVIWRH
jgi:rhomboid protease GluP